MGIYHVSKAIITVADCDKQSFVMSYKGVPGSGYETDIPMSSGWASRSI